MKKPFNFNYVFRAFRFTILTFLTQLNGDNPLYDTRNTVMCFMEKRLF